MMPHERIPSLDFSFLDLDLLDQPHFGRTLEMLIKPPLCLLLYASALSLLLHHHEILVLLNFCQLLRENGLLVPHILLMLLVTAFLEELQSHYAYASYHEFSYLLVVLDSLLL